MFCHHFNIDITSGFILMGKIEEESKQLLNTVHLSLCSNFRSSYDYGIRMDVNSQCLSSSAGVRFCPNSIIILAP